MTNKNLLERIASISSLIIVLMSFTGCTDDQDQEISFWEGCSVHWLAIVLWIVGIAGIIGAFIALMKVSESSSGEHNKHVDDDHDGGDEHGHGGEKSDWKWFVKRFLVLALVGLLLLAAYAVIKKKYFNDSNDSKKTEVTAVNSTPPSDTIYHKYDVIKVIMIPPRKSGKKYTLKGLKGHMFDTFFTDETGKVLVEIRENGQFIQNVSNIGLSVSPTHAEAIAGCDAVFESRQDEGKTFPIKIKFYPHYEKPAR